jgi:hypothetical protein
VNSQQRIPVRRDPGGEFMLRLAAGAGPDRHRGPVAAATGTLCAAIAIVERWLWPDVSLALAYAIPISLAAYVFGLRGGVLSVVAVLVAASHHVIEFSEPAHAH